MVCAFSGGKDSTVILNLCLDEAERRGRLPLDVHHYDEEAIPFQTEEYVRVVDQREDCTVRWLCLPVKHVNACAPSSPWWYPWDPDCPEKWVRPLPPEAITEWEGFPLYPPEDRPQPLDLAGLFFPAEKYGSVAFVMGIRADESMTRTRAVTRKMNDNFLVVDPGTYNKGNVVKCYPIYDFDTSDVWTFARDHSRIGYNLAYDFQELHGFHGSRQRIAPPFGAEPMQMLGMYKTCFPEVWEKMYERVPGAATAARYARGELYAFRGRPKPREGESWRDLIIRLLDKHEPSNRRKIGKRLNEEVRWHRSKTTNPILVAPHPVTGMSLEWLAMIALRGDIKRRKVAGWELGEDSPETRRRNADEYREAYEAWKRGEGEAY